MSAEKVSPFPLVRKVRMLERKLKDLEKNNASDVEKLKKKNNCLQARLLNLEDKIDDLYENHYFELRDLKDSTNKQIFFVPKIRGIIQFLNMRKEYMEKL